MLAALAPAPLARAELRAKLHGRNERLGDTLTRLAHAGKIRRAVLTEAFAATR